jgi:hypothetical protein
MNLYLYHNILRMRFVLTSFLFLLMAAKSSFGQSLRFRTVFAGEPIHWNDQEFQSEHVQKIRFSDFSFYLSDFSWYEPGGKVLHEHDRVELLKAGPEEDSMVVSAPFQSNRVCFRFGLDSTIQVSGRTDGALDPALGMYWAWNTGYIQCRLEGYSPDSKGKKGKFEFHLGGYNKPYSTDFKMCLDLKAESGKPEILVDLKPLMDAVSLKKNWSVLSPGAPAWEFSRLIGFSFQSSAGK